MRVVISVAVGSSSLRGAELLRYCRERLQVLEEQVKVLDEQGGVHGLDV